MSLEVGMGQPVFSPEIADQLARVLESGQLVQDRSVEAFEKQAADYLQVSHAIAVSNGTVALELALAKMGVGYGCRVGVPAYSFVASANAVVRVGATPVFIDVQAEDLTMDPQATRILVEDGALDALLPVDEFGFPSSVNRLREIAPSLPIVEDAACAFGTECEPAIGSCADVSCYSLHPRKVLTSGEGGLICTNNDELASEFRLIRNHGMVKSTQGIDSIEIGTNARMTEIQAVLALDQLKTLPSRLERRREIAGMYFRDLQETNLLLPQSPDNIRLNWQTFLVRFPNSATRNRATVALATHGVASSIAAQCIPAMTAYVKPDNDAHVAAVYPNAWNAWTTGLGIPCHEGMSNENVAKIVTVLKDIEVKT